MYTTGRARITERNHTNNSAFLKENIILVLSCKSVFAATSTESVRECAIKGVPKNAIRERANNKKIELCAF